MKLPKVYQPSHYEADIYKLWEKSDAFTPRGEGPSFSIVFPPPNANGDLHLGHALTLALQDITIRYHRLKGDRVLFVPGADHAGFETQVVYEKELARQGKSRFDFTREEMYKQIWDFVAQNRSKFNAQLRLLGGSFDWSAFTFTLDEKVIDQAYQTFKKMWQEKLIYRSERLVNFCTFHGTAFADIEVVHREEKGTLWYIRYPLTDGTGDITVATSRPETMLGDTAVAVNPSDKRYLKLIGKTITLPLTNRQIPIVGDEFVDKSFGSGAVKITPAHDPNDYEVAKRHNLPFISVIMHTGKISHDMPEPYRGLSIKAARKKVVEDLTDQEFLIKAEDYKHSVGHCYKCDTVIEPLLREQWFVDMKPLAKKAIEALKDDQITFYPKSKKSQTIAYLEQLKDWNISRQIAWGIPIPAFQNVEDGDDWIYDERVDQETIEVGNKTYHRDPDVFDTWFSSSSWPYVTLGYPKSDNYLQFYPLNLMETGGEILYPWVSRMIMMGLYATGKKPFDGVYIHGYVMAEDGSKMSKSVGNVISPLKVIEEFGSDALRMGIISGRVAAVNRGYDSRRVEEARNFGNKLWNVARYIEDKANGSFESSDSLTPTSAADHWILVKLGKLAKDIDKNLTSYHFSEAYDSLYHFVWDDFADWYIEYSKVNLNQQVLSYCLKTILKLAHPFAPFVTETIWQTLDIETPGILANSRLDSIKRGSLAQSKEFEEVIAIVSETRTINNNLNVIKPTLLYSPDPFMTRYATTIKVLARLSDVLQTDEASSGLHLNNTIHNCWLYIDKSKIDKYLVDLNHKIEAQQNIVQQLRERLTNKKYTSNAPKAVVDQTRDQLSSAEELLASMHLEQHRFTSIA